MLLFIAFPLVSVVLQSVHTAHEAVLVTVENCGPFGCKKETTIDQDATSAIRAAEPLGRFVGLDIYFDRGHLAIAEVKQHGHQLRAYPHFVKLLAIYHFTGQWHLPSPLPLQ